MDKTLTKLVADHAGIPQAAWELVCSEELSERLESTLERLENRFAYPMFVKPAGTGSSVGVSKAANREALAQALACAGKFDRKILVEEFIPGREIEVAVMGNDSPRWRAPGSSTGRSWWRSSSRAGKSRWPLWATTAPWPPSAAKLTPAWSFPTTMPSISGVRREVRPEDPGGGVHPGPGNRGGRYGQRQPRGLHLRRN